MTRIAHIVLVALFAIVATACGSARPNATSEKGDRCQADATFLNDLKVFRGEHICHGDVMAYRLKKEEDIYTTPICSEDGTCEEVTCFRAEDRYHEADKWYCRSPNGGKVWVAYPICLPGSTCQVNPRVHMVDDAYSGKTYFPIPTPPAPATPTTTANESRPRYWGSMVWVDYQTTQVWGMNDMSEGFISLEKDTELKKTGEKDGFVLFAPPAGFKSVFITEVGVDFARKRVKYLLPLQGLSFELPAGRMESEMSGYRFVPDIYKVDMDQLPLSCRGNPLTSEAKKLVDDLAVHGIACTP